jgi:hypothetical protein
MQYTVEITDGTVIKSVHLYSEQDPAHWECWDAVDEDDLRVFPRGASLWIRRVLSEHGKVVLAEEGLR